MTNHNGPICIWVHGIPSFMYRGHWSCLYLNSSPRLVYSQVLCFNQHIQIHNDIIYQVSKLLVGYLFQVLGVFRSFSKAIETSA